MKQLTVSNEAGTCKEWVGLILCVNNCTERKSKKEQGKGFYMLYDMKTSNKSPEIHKARAHQ
jgi:hypothetical protein